MKRRQRWPFDERSAATKRLKITWTAVTRCTAQNSTACVTACIWPAWPVWPTADQASNSTEGVNESALARFASRWSKVANPDARELRAK